ncbi:MAG TPA: hypothetical protein VF791_08235 [Pyrinomonadaceae bacterium]
MKSRFLSFILLGTMAVCALSFTGGAEAQRRRPRRAQVCGDPAMNCGEANEFQPHDLQFRMPRNAVIYETESFYAIILMSINARDNCDAFIGENERQEAQALFPRHKVFTDRCPEPTTIYYTNTNPNNRFMAVYAGKTRAEANAMLARVRATGKYPGANLRQMRAGFNGT